jgi:cytochrome b561
MHWKNTEEKYGMITRLFHVILALALLAQIFVAIVMGDFADKATNMLFYQIHKSLGVSILVVGFLFVLWHLVSRKPKFLATMKPYENVIASLVHWLLLAFFVIEPLLGVVMASYAGRPINVWSWFTFILPVTPNASVAEVLADIHVVLGWTFAGLIGLHILAALKHAVINKDGVLRRMF